MSAPKIRVHFTDFWSGFDHQDNFVVDALRPEFDPIPDPHDPEIVFYSCFGSDHLDHECTRVFLSGENQVPDFNLCDYAVSMNAISFGPRHLNFPLYALEAKVMDALTGRPPLTLADVEGRAFCNFIYSNPTADPIRDAFFHVLTARRPVASFGRHLKNTEVAFADRYETDFTTSKIEAMRDYIFSIAFENGASDHYTTEKLPHALAARTIPIYWGDARVTDMFNPGCLIEARHFESLDALADHVLALADDPDRLLDHLNTPVFPGDALPEALRFETLRAFLQAIAARPTEDRRIRPHHSRIAVYEAQVKRDKLRAAQMAKLRNPKLALRDWLKGGRG